MDINGSTFGGTSCAVPTVGGKLACWMEKHYTLNGVYPSPDQVKSCFDIRGKGIPQYLLKQLIGQVFPLHQEQTINPQQAFQF